MDCPGCKAPMLVVEYDDVELDHCARCGGTWFDHDELSLLLTDKGDEALAQLKADMIAALPDAATLEKPRRCPRCRDRMRKVNIGPAQRVMVDVCPQGHGLWFDRGEVRELVADLPTTGDDLPARALRFLGGVIRRGEPAASETEDA